MHIPKGRLTDFFSLSEDPQGTPRTALILDRLTHEPKAGDVLRIGDQNLTIAQVDGRRMRNCLTGRWLMGRGSVAIAINASCDDLKPLLQPAVHTFLSWTAKDDLPWHFSATDLPRFTKLNTDWNADPNDAGLRIVHEGTELLAHMRPNLYKFKRFKGIASITVTFKNCARYRVTPINDYAWYAGDCRFSGLAPQWGEFYEIAGNTQDALDPSPWITAKGHGTRHFHFYLRDQTLEVKASGWSLKTSN